MPGGRPTAAGLASWGTKANTDQDLVLIDLAATGKEKLKVRHSAKRIQLPAIRRKFRRRPYRIPQKFASRQIPLTAPALYIPPFQSGLFRFASMWTK